MCCVLYSGLQERLDHFEYLGVEAIWLSPIYRSPMVDFGYDVSDYRDVDPTFGTMSDLESFIAAAQRKGWSVIYDVKLISSELMNSK